MTDISNPALAEMPADGVAAGALRERLNIAIALAGSGLSEAQLLILAEAASKPSPVDMAVAVFDAMMASSDGDGSPEVWTLCTAALKSRAIEAADLIAEHSWHGKGDAAATFASAARATLS